MRRTTVRWLWLVAPACLAGVGLCVASSCQPAFPTEIPAEALVISITGGNTGSQANPVPITFVTPDVFTVHIEAHVNGAIDKSFKGYVRLSIQPGNVVSVTGENTNGRNVELIDGPVTQDVQVAVVGAFGQANIVVQDLGYLPIDPEGTVLPDGGVQLPQCSNGIDDNDNGLVDYGVDPGCYAPNDNTENGGTYAEAATGPIYFDYPRIADVEGVSNDGAGTPFPSEQVQVNTGWKGTTASTTYGVVVTGVASTGFFVTDIAETRGYASLYGYTYTAPQLMNVCDRLITLGGTAAEFYGFLELNYPTYSLEEWDPLARPCLVPEPTPITIADLFTTTGEVQALTPLEAGLVRIPPDDGSTIHIAGKLGPGLIPYTTLNGVVTIGAITENVTSCDYEGTGKIDFSNAAEAACETACEADVECSEYSAYQGNSQFQLVMVNATGTTSVGITGDGSASAGFNPVALRGTPLKAFTGNLTYFSGGSQFTIQARCSDDIVPVGGTILPSSPPWPVPDGGTQAPAACVVNSAISQVTN